MSPKTHWRAVRSSPSADRRTDLPGLSAALAVLLVIFVAGCGEGRPPNVSWLTQNHYGPGARRAPREAPRLQVAPRKNPPRNPPGFVVEVRVRETWVRLAPSSRSPHRGVVRRGARLRSVGLVHGAGCPLGWLQLTNGGYLCAEEALATRRHPGGARLPLMAPGALLPFRYVAVGPEGSGEYLQPEDAASDYFLRELAPHNALTVEARLKVGGDWFWRTTRGTYVPASEVYPIQASTFAGQPLAGVFHLPLAFVHRARAPLYRAPERPGGGWLPRYRRASVLGESGHLGRRFVELGPQQWVHRRDVRMAVQKAPPEGVGPEEAWVDVDVGEQVLVAYRGARPVFATLVSTGRGARTPLGTFRIWVKLAATDMRSGPKEEGRPYQLWDVPWAAFFSGDFGLHGTYWHDRFGHKKSAGCVNLSPRDAAWIFDLLTPRLLPGWWAVIARGRAEGSVVRVRDSQLPERRRLPRPAPRRTP